MNFSSRIEKINIKSKYLLNNNIILGIDSPMFLKRFQIIVPSKLSHRHVMGKQLLVSKFSESRSV